VLARSSSSATFSLGLQVKEIAPEFYDDLPQCKSWPGVILRYIFDDAIGPFSRVKRRPDPAKKD